MTRIFVRNFSTRDVSTMSVLFQVIDNLKNLAESVDFKRREDSVREMCAHRKNIYFPDCDEERARYLRNALLCKLRGASFCFIFSLSISIPPPPPSPFLLLSETIEFMIVSRRVRGQGRGQRGLHKRPALSNA